MTLNPDNYRYFTQRTYKDDDGNAKGSIRVLVKKEADGADCLLKCPECGKENTITKEWKKPFSVNCPDCGFLLKVEKLNKKEKKKKK